MTQLVTILLSYFIVGAQNQQVDRACVAEHCQTLTVRNGEVRFIENTPPARDLLLGPYLTGDKRLVPRTEAPIRELRSQRGWRVVVSALLDHREHGVLLRVRFLNRMGKLQTTDDLLMVLESAEVGNLFGGNDEILTITSNEEHAYNAQTSVWFLPAIGKPRRLLSFTGAIGEFQKSNADGGPGVRINRESYDGVNANTKGHTQEFWSWNPQQKTLNLGSRGRGNR
jgi:hypothetical protein